MAHLLRVNYNDSIIQFLQYGEQQHPKGGQNVQFAKI
jgi:hypothetical protein